MPAENRFIIAPDKLGPDDLPDMFEAKVTRVFDGDGFLADVLHPRTAEWIERISFRLAFIDAPEMEQPLGPEAQAFLHRSITGRTLRLDPIGKESSGYMPIDPYKRMLCMAYLTEEVEAGETEYFLDGKCRAGVVKTTRLVTRNVELEMVINGWAWVLQQYAFDREEEYFAAQENARHARRGLWAMDDPEPPWRFKQRHRRKRKAANQQASLFVERCQANGCNGRLVERAGPSGRFLGCSNFPQCRFSRAP